MSLASDRIYVPFEHLHSGGPFSSRCQNCKKGSVDDGLTVPGVKLLYLHAQVRRPFPVHLQRRIKGRLLKGLTPERSKASFIGLPVSPPQGPSYHVSSASPVSVSTPSFIRAGISYLSSRKNGEPGRPSGAYNKQSRRKLVKRTGWPIFLIPRRRSGT